MKTYTLKVIDIVHETEDTKTICFKQPGLKKIKYQAGQYLTLIFRINGRRYIRPYSFSSAPEMDESLNVTVKRVPNGLISNHINDVIQIGDSIEVMSPMGDFVYGHPAIVPKYILLWGVGSGVTPLISLIKQMLVTLPNVKVNLVYGNRNQESTIFSDLINRLLERYPDSFEVWHFHTQLSVMENPPYLVQGRITEKSVFDIMNGIGADQSLHYICGPTGLKESVKNSLFQLNVSPDQILSEDFELIKDPKDFEDINTQLIKLTFEQQEYKLEVVKGKSVLECALDAGIELPYSCQTGNCNTCLAKLKKGSLKMIGLTVVRQDLLADEYLMCCSHPLTEDVCIEI